MHLLLERRMLNNMSHPTRRFDVSASSGNLSSFGAAFDSLL
jgi:hypothetical protein